MVEVFDRWLIGVRGVGLPSSLQFALHPPPLQDHLNFPTLSRDFKTNDIILLLFIFFCAVIITYINCYSVNLATGVQNAFTAAKLVAVFVVVTGGVYKIFQGRTEHFRNYFENTTTSMGDVATAFYSGLWAYDGWNNLNYVTEEIKNPSK